MPDAIESIRWCPRRLCTLMYAGLSTQDVVDRLIAYVPEGPPYEDRMHLSLVLRSVLSEDERLYEYVEGAETLSRCGSEMMPWFVTRRNDGEFSRINEMMWALVFLTRLDSRTLFAASAMMVILQGALEGPWPRRVCASLVRLSEDVLAVWPEESVEEAFLFWAVLACLTHRDTRFQQALQTRCRLTSCAPIERDSVREAMEELLGDVRCFFKQEWRADVVAAVESVISLLGPGKGVAH